jgi:hypothetical protein
MPAVKMTIVGGRPPGCGRELGAIPRGVEVLVKKASVDPWFKALLMSQRAGAAGAIGLTLAPAEVTLLNFIPAAQLDAVIARTKVEPGKMPAFLGKAAAVMLVALGASTAPAQIAPTKGASPGPAGPVVPMPPNPNIVVVAGLLVRSNVYNLVMLIDRGTLKQSLDAQKQLLDMDKSAIPEMQQIISRGQCKPETNKTVQAIIDAINGGPATQPAGPDYRQVHTLLSQIEYGDEQAIQNAMKKLQDMGKVIVPHLKRSLAEDKWKAATTDNIKLLIATLAKLPDTQPATEPAQPKAVPVEGVPAEVTDLVALLDSKDFRACRDAQAKLLDMGAPVVPQLQKVIKEGKPNATAQTRMEQVITALTPPQVPDQVRPMRGARADAQPPPPDQIRAMQGVRADTTPPPPPNVPAPG